MMNRIQKCLFLLILLFAAFHVFLGIDCGIPSRERMETELGGKTVLENHLPELEQFLAAGSYERSEFSGETGEEENSARSRFSPFLDQLRSYHPDEQFTLKTISTMVKNRTLQPGAYIYGQFYHYQIASALAAAALAGYLPMDLNTLSGLRNPETAGRLYLAGRFLTCCMALGGIVLLFFSVKILTGRVVPALAAAALLATVPFYALTAKVIKTEMPSCFWLLAVLLFSVLAYRSGKWRFYLAAGAALGLAVGTKYTAALYAVLPAGYFLARYFPEKWRSAGAWKQLLGSKEMKGEFLALCGAGGMSLAVFTIFNFSWLTDSARFFHDITLVSRLMGDRNRILAFLEYVACFSIDGIFFHIGLLTVPLFLISVLFALFRPRRETLPLLAAVFLYFYLASTSIVASSDRYMLPALPLLCILAVFCLEAVRRVWLRRLLLGAVLAAGVWYSLAMDWVMLAKNTRLEASEWCAGNLPEGASVGRAMYPVSYRTVMLPYGRWREFNALENPGKIPECDYYVDCSFIYDMLGRSPLMRRLDWIFNRPRHIPSTGSFPAGEMLVFGGGDSLPPTPARLLSGPRFFILNSFLEMVMPEIVLYRNALKSSSPSSPFSTPPAAAAAFSPSDSERTEDGGVPAGSPPAAAEESSGVSESPENAAPLQDP